MTLLPRNWWKFGLVSISKKQPSDFSDMPIWYNSFVRIDNKPIYYKVRVHMNVEPRSTMNTNGETDN